MNHSTLARRLEEFAADLEPLRLTEAPTAQEQVVRQILGPRRPARRTTRVGGIQLREQGLRSFRVR